MEHAMNNTFFKGLLILFYAGFSFILYASDNPQIDSNPNETPFFIPKLKVIDDSGTKTDTGVITSKEEKKEKKRKKHKKQKKARKARRVASKKK